MPYTHLNMREIKRICHSNHHHHQIQNCKMKGIALRLLCATVSVLVTFPLSEGTTIPVFREKIVPVCGSGEAVCDESCYTLETQACLTYSDGSGGTVCQKGESFCGGKCLDPSSGNVCLEGQSGYQVICKRGQSVCSFQNCYDADKEDCINGKVLCPKGQILCGFGGGSCYQPSDDIHCLQGDFNSYICKKSEKLCPGNKCHPKDQFC